jgi:hypothetical protein
MPLIKSISLASPGLFLPPLSDRRYLLRSYHIIAVLGNVSHVLYFGCSYSDTDPPDNYGRIIGFKYQNALVPFTDQRRNIDYRFPKENKLFLGDVGEGIGYWLSGSTIRTAFIRFEEIFV